MFTGGYTNNMDDKGRVNIPASFRDVLHQKFNDDRIIVTLHNIDNCLRAYPLQEWEAFLEKLRSLPSSDRTVRLITRRVVSSAFEYTPDKQGRILLAPTLRDWAGLSKTIRFAGANNTFEIWDEARWQSETSQTESLDDEVLARLGI